MSDKNELKLNFGNGVTTTLLIVFIVFKLTNVINWSWWWILSPFWIPLSLAIVLATLLIIIEYAEKQ